jgi:AcrR family transcriptional regulator
MPAKKPAKRTYNSSRRQQQAGQTRLQIVEAARILFMQRGYAGATLEAIAQQAGVAVETVYASFGNKRAILAKLIDVSVVGDDQPVPLLERPGPQTVLHHETDQHRQIELFVEEMYLIMGRMAPIFEVMRVAAKTEADISDMLQNILKARLQGMLAFVKALMKNGPLRAGLTAQDAAELVWMLTSGEVYILLVSDGHWTEKKYTQRMRDALERLLLP